MMRAADLKEAQEIVGAIAYLDKALSMTLPQQPTEHSSLQLFGNKTPGYHDTYEKNGYVLTLAAREAAHKVMVAGWTSRRAELVRRAAQIGLMLEKKA